MISPRLFKTWSTLLIVVFVVASTLFTLLGTPRAITGGTPILGWLDPVIAGAVTAVSASPLAFAICAIMPKSEVGRVFDETKCPDCEYDLTGLESNRCPECGRFTDRAPTGTDLDQ